MTTKGTEQKVDLKLTSNYTHNYLYWQNRRLATLQPYRWRWL